MRLALYQNDSAPGDPARQMDSLAGVARDLRNRADLLVTPELFLSGYRLGAGELRSLAQPAAGSFARDIGAIARENAIAIHIGFPERDGASVFNSSLTVGRDGEHLALYRKLHLPSAEEREVFAPGGGIVTFDLLGFRVASLICYDVEFPESVRAYARAGADLVLVPTALRQHWAAIAEQVIPVRARENGVFLAYCNYAGTENDWRYAGLSSICAPDGAVLAKAGPGEDVILATLDRTAIAAARSHLPYLADCRFTLQGPD